MSKKIKCKVCNGWGLLEKKVECKRCNGKGHIQKNYDTYTHSIKQTCPCCNGTGSIRLRCRMCEGYGWYKLREQKIRLGTKRLY